MGQKGCPEMLVRIYDYSLCNNPEECSSHFITCLLYSLIYFHHVIVFHMTDKEHDYRCTNFNHTIQQAYPTYYETKYLVVTITNSTHLLPSLLQRCSNFISCWGNLSYSTKSPCCSLIVWKSTSLIKSEYKTNGSSSSVIWIERLYGYTKINVHTCMNNKQIQNTKSTAIISNTNNH